MTFDGIPYVDAGLIYPARHHPGSPLTGPALGDALRIAYCCARRHGRILLTQHTAQNFADPRGSAELTAFSSGAPLRIAEGMALIPLGATHLVAEIIYRVWEAPADAESFHKLSIDDGANTDAGDIATLEVTESGELRAACEVELDTVSAGSTVEISLTGYAAATVGGVPDAGIAYTALVTRVWWEVRG